MGLKALIATFLERVYPARVAPFVQMVATAIISSPEAFSVDYQEGANLLRVRLVEGCNTSKMGSDLADQGVGVDVDFFDNSMAIVTYYFDSIPLNWRERRVMMEALDLLLDAHQDALTQSMVA